MRLFVTFSLVLLMAAIAGCNTTRGMGQDIEAAGQKIEDLADDTQDELNDDD